MSSPPSSSGVGGSDPPLPPGWVKTYSNSQKRHYYSHPQTKHTQWHFPTASEAADPAKAAKRARENMEKAKKQQHHKPSSSSHRSSGSSGSAKRSHREEETGLGDIVSSVSTTITSPTATKRSRVSGSGATDPTLALADSTSVAIIVPYRDLHPLQNRARHLAAFVPHMIQFMNKQMDKGVVSDYHIYIVEQSDDKRKFNRGKLLNIGFDYARKSKRVRHPHDVFIFHDVDLLPSDALGSWYARFPKSPIHIARVWDRYSNNPKYFGGIVSFSSSDMKRINGYPNTFWGWGGEDDEMQNRLERLRIKWDYPPSNLNGTVRDLEDMTLKEKLDFLRSNKKWKCMVKWEALEEHAATWKVNGLANLDYQLLNVEALDKGGRASKVTVDVKLNPGHWGNDKCGVEYMGG